MAALEQAGFSLKRDAAGNVAEVSVSADQDVATALQRLAEEGLLSEARYLESFVAYRARAGYGPQRIREELGQRGLEAGLIFRRLRTARYRLPAAQPFSTGCAAARPTISPMP